MSGTAPKRALSAYMVFSNEHREAVRQELLAVGSKVSVSEVAKELGARWKALSEEQQAVYREQAQQLRQQAATEASDAPDLEAEEPPSTLPMATIRKIMLLDSEVKRVQPDAVALVARAAEMFVASTTQQAARHACACKRKTVKLEDVRVVGNKDRRWADMGLGAVLQALAADHGAPKGGREAGARAAPVGVRQLTHFYSSK